MLRQFIFISGYCMLYEMHGKVEVNIAGWRVGIASFLLAAINMREPHMYHSRMTFNMSVTYLVGRSKVG